MEEDRMTSIAAFMKKEMVTASPEESVAEVTRRMRDADVGAVVVVRDGQLAGVFSERDLLTRVVAEGRSADATPLGEVATDEVVSVTGDAPIKACAEKLRDHHLRHLLVVDGKKPIGIISARDFFGEVAARMEALIERARYDEQLRNNLDPYDHIGGSYGR